MSTGPKTAPGGYEGEVRLLAGKGEEAVRKESAELVSEAIAFIDSWKNQDRRHEEGQASV